MGFFDRWSPNDDGSFTDTQDSDSSGDDSSGSNEDSDDSAPPPTDSSNPRVGLGGGGGVSDTTGDSGDDDDDDDDDDDSSGPDVPVGNRPGGPSSPVGGGSSGGSDNPFGGDDDGPDLPDEPSVDTDNPFDDSGSSGGGSSGSGGSSDDGSSGDDGGGSDVPVGNTPASGNLPSQSGESPDPGQGIGPGGVSGSEAATPDSETDAPTNDSTQGIDATRTGKLEDTASDPQIRQQAEALEDDVAGRQVTDVVDGLNTTGAELREEDVEVTRSGDTLEAQLSPVGEERVQNIADRQATEQAERAVESELNTAFTDSDVSVNDDGSVDVSQDVQNEATEQALAEQNPGVQEGDVGFQNGEPQVQQPQDPLSGSGEVSQPDPLGGNESESTERNSPFGGPAAFENETGLDQGEDFTVQRNDGNVTVNVTQRGAQELQGRQEQEEGDALTPIVEDFEGVTGVDLPGNTSEAGEARVQRANDPAQETFGGDGGIEQTLRNAGEGFTDTAETVSDPLGDALAANPLVDMVDPTPDGIDTRSFENATEPQTQEEENRAELFSGTGQGAAEIFNVPRLGATAIEGGEVLEEGIDATAVGGGTEEDFEQFERDVGGAAALSAVDTTRAAQQSPFDTTGQVLGGAVSASGFMAAGRAVGGSTGARTAAAAVQPGEELLKALRRTDTPDTSASAASSGGTQLGSGGTGTLLDADALDDGRGPSTRSRVRGRIQRSDTYQTLSESLEQFRRDTSGQLEFAPQRDRGGSGGDSAPDTLSDFDPSRSEVLEGSPRDRLSGDVTDRARTQRRQTGGTYDGGRQSDAGRTRAEPEGARRRRERAQRQEATEPPRTPNDRPEASGRRRTGVDATAGLGGALAGSETQSAVEQPSVTPSPGFQEDVGTGTEASVRPDVDAGLGLDTGIDTRLDVGLNESTRLDTRTETRSRFETRLDERTETRQEFRNETRTETRTEARTEIETGVRIENRFDTPFETNFGDERNSDDREFQTAGPSFEDVEFNNAVATPSEVLGFGSFDTSSSGEQGGFDDNGFDVSGGLF